MKASLDTNLMIHVYRAGLQHILFDLFKDGLVIYEQIRKVELEHHGQDVLKSIDKDIQEGKIQVFTDEMLKEQSVFTMFSNYVKENRQLYGSSDLGEVYAISLAQTLGGFSLATDDTKQGGPYMSLLQLDYNVMPFTFADVLILRYLFGLSGAIQTVEYFNCINDVCNMKWSFQSHISKFIRRFLSDPYKDEEKAWFTNVMAERTVWIKKKFEDLYQVIARY